MTPKNHVSVSGIMQVNFTVELPIEACHESVVCDDPAKEAALQAVSQCIQTYLWGEDRPPAVVYADVWESDVEIESDDRDVPT